MRNFKSFALIAALALSNAAYAVTPSTPVDYDNATATGLSTEVGTFKQKVSFNIVSSSVDLTVMKPGQAYTITIPVENTTDRDIAVSLDDVTATDGDEAVALIEASHEVGTELVIPAGEILPLTIVVTTGTDAGLSNVKVTIGYTVNGTATEY